LLRDKKSMKEETALGLRRLSERPELMVFMAIVNKWSVREMRVKVCVA
jgi:hypothetical protein